MKTSVAASVVALASIATARDLPSNVENFYDSVRGQQQCRNVLAGGFHSIQDDSGGKKATLRIFFNTFPEQQFAVMPKIMSNTSVVNLQISTTAVTTCKTTTSSTSKVKTANSSTWTLTATASSTAQPTTAAAAPPATLSPSHLLPTLCVDMGPASAIWMLMRIRMWFLETPVADRVMRILIRSSMELSR